MSIETNQVLHEVAEERKRQDIKWGEQNHYDEKWMLILMEEVGEIARGILEGHHPASNRKEIMQTAAVCAAWLECIDRKLRTERTVQP